MSPGCKIPQTPSFQEQLGCGWLGGAQWKDFLLTSRGVDPGAHAHRHIVGASLAHRVSHSQLEDVCAFLQVGQL